MNSSKLISAKIKKEHSTYLYAFLVVQQLGCSFIGHGHDWKMRFCNHKVQTCCGCCLQLDGCFVLNEIAVSWPLTRGTQPQNTFSIRPLNTKRKTLPIRRIKNWCFVKGFNFWRKIATSTVLACCAWCSKSVSDLLMFLSPAVV